MKFTYTPGYARVVIDLEGDEQDIVRWMQENFSSMEFINYVQNFINQRREQMYDTVKEHVWKNLKGDPEFHDFVSKKLNVKIPGAK